MHSFEASPQHLKILQHNVGRNPRVTIHHCAVGNESGTASISEFDPLVSDNFGCTAVGNTGTDVAMQRIDDMLLPYPHVMKIDVEGHECAVMQGAEQTIKKFKPVIVIEQKFHKDVGHADDGEAVRLLNSFGVHQLDKVRNDYIFGWPT